MERLKLFKTSQLLTLPFLALLGFVSPTKFFLSLFHCVPVAGGALKKGNNLTVNTSLAVTALQPGWEWSPVFLIGIPGELLV